jgi:leucyl aminopeptidase
MIIEYSAFPLKDKNNNILNVIISLDVQVKSMMETKYNQNNVGDKLITENGRFVFFGINEKYAFMSAKRIARQISVKFSKEEILCIYLPNIANKDKLLILQLVAKYLYKFDKYIAVQQKSKIEQKIVIVDEPKNKRLIYDIISQIKITNLNRDFQNEPANIIYPETFVQYAKKLLEDKNQHSKCDVKVMDHVQLKKLGFNLVLEIGKASVHKPRFMVINMSSSLKNAKTICLIGKGVTFDTGSINLKRSDNKLFEMKSDKLGATTVVSIIKYFMKYNNNLNIIGLIPLIENAISGDVVYPGDIVRSFGGQTVEILNNDAEGRLIMADALEYAGKFKKIDYIFDIATLTGSAAYFHCDTTAAILTFNDPIKKMIEEISENVGERIYTLPSWPEYMNLTNSDVANVQNIDTGDCPRSGSFMAGMFLLRFVPKHLRQKWVHFDVTNSYLGHLSNGNCTILIINLIKQIIKKDMKKSNQL